MKYCCDCGNELILKECKNEGKIPYCPVCKSYHFPTFHSAISAIIFNPDQDKILLIQQYGKTANILVAGYINKGENANEALLREIKEEVSLNVTHYEYNDNEYFAKTNTLIHNFIVDVDSEAFQTNEEVDKAQWFTIEEAVQQIKEKSLAKQFLFKALHTLKRSEKLFLIEKERILLNDSNDQLLAEITFPLINGKYVINHTFVDPSLRGLGIASKLVEAAYHKIKAEKQYATATCSYAIKWFKTHPEKQDILIQ